MPSYVTANIHERIRDNAKARATPKTRIINTEEKCPIGYHLRQGDVYMTRLPIHADLTVFGRLKPTDNRQVVPDDDSIGSRHILRPGSAKLLKRLDGGPLDGPIIVAPDGFYLEHPTHGDFDVSLPGTYVITFPRDFSKEEIVRLRD